MKTKPEQIADFRNRMTHGSIKNRLKAAYELAKNGLLEGQDLFLNALDDEDEDVRSEAAEMLGNIGASWAIDPLGKLVHDEESEVCNVAIFALLETCQIAAVDWLIEALKNEEDERREDARVALAALLGDSATSTMNLLLSSEDEARNVLSWWQKNKNRYAMFDCYAWGKPVDLEQWIEMLESAPLEQASWLAQRLIIWTGNNIDEKNPREAVIDWRKWWKDHKSHFEKGKRYFYGHLMNVP